MSSSDLYNSFKNASVECINFLNLKCMKCHYCNNCIFCELYCNLSTINEWFLIHINHPEILADNSTRALIFRELQIKHNLQYSYEHHNYFRSTLLFHSPGRTSSSFASIPYTDQESPLPQTSSNEWFWELTGLPLP